MYNKEGGVNMGYIVSKERILVKETWVIKVERRERGEWEDKRINAVHVGLF